MLKNKKDFEPLLTAAEHVLSNSLGSRIRINGIEGLSEDGRRNLLLRCFIDPIYDRPSSFILKKVETENYNPEDINSWDTMRFFGDWVGAQFLSTISRQSDHSPHFCGGDRNLGFLILEDLGSHFSLVQPLLEQECDRADKTLLKYAARLGQMHTDTIGKAPIFRELFHSVSPNATLSPPQEATLLNRHLPSLLTRLGDLGIHVDSDISQELETIVRTITNPGPFLAYIHADPCPDNVFDTDEALRLIDFEFGHFGHALIDAAYGRMLFPSCWCASRLPQGIMSQMEATYRAKLIQGCPEAQDDRVYETALVIVCGYWLLNTLIRHLEETLKSDRRWGISTTRQRILARLEAFINTSEEFSKFPSLRGMSSRLSETLHQQWADTPPISLYPAFQVR
jgi:hypothetical protein